MTRAVREELAHHEGAQSHQDECERCAEAAAICRFAGALHVLGPEEDVVAEGVMEEGVGAGPYWVVTVSTGAVARRLQHTLVDHLNVRPTLGVRKPGGLRTSSAFSLAVPLPRPAGGGGGAEPAIRLGLLDAAGALVREPALPASHVERRGWLRGAAMTVLSVSAPQRPPHLEMQAPTVVLAKGLTEVLRQFGAPSARMSARVSAAGEQRYRVVVKSGDQIGAVLAALGAHQAFLDRDLRRLERSLRSDANRAANADRANLDRTATAAARQVAQVHKTLQRLDNRPPAADLPERIPEDLLATALARVANPEATLTEVGQLLDPPVGRATVYRRIQRFVAMGSPEKP